MRTILLVENGPLALKILEHLFRKESLQHQADVRLYQAKHQGRACNCWQ